MGARVTHLKNTDKIVAFDTLKNFVGLTDFKAYLVDASGAVVSGTPVTFVEKMLAADMFTPVAITAGIAVSDTTFTVGLSDATNFFVGQLVEVKEGATQAFPLGTKVKAVDTVTGIITVDTPATAIVTSSATAGESKHTGTYVTTILGTSLTTAGVYYIRLRCPSKGQDQEYGMLDVVDVDVSTVAAQVTNLATQVTNLENDLLNAINALGTGTSTSFGKILL